MPAVRLFVTGCRRVISGAVITFSYFVNLFSLI